MPSFEKGFTSSHLISSSLTSGAYFFSPITRKAGTTKKRFKTNLYSNVNYSLRMNKLVIFHILLFPFSLLFLSEMLIFLEKRLKRVSKPPV